MFPDFGTSALEYQAFLCLRRGVSCESFVGRSLLSFSLPTQRCFPDDVREPYDDGLFSAYAEVFPTAIMASAATTAFLCLRRGVSIEIQSDKKSFRLFSAYAEVFPFSRGPLSGIRPFLCLRRGVSWQHLPSLIC